MFNFHIQIRSFAGEKRKTERGWKYGNGLNLLLWRCTITITMVTVSEAEIVYVCCVVNFGNQSADLLLLLLQPCQIPYVSQAIVISLHQLRCLLVYSSLFVYIVDSMSYVRIAVWWFVQRSYVLEQSVIRQFPWVPQFWGHHGKIKLKFAMVFWHIWGRNLVRGAPKAKWDLF